MEKYLRVFFAAILGFIAMVLTLAICYWLGGDKDTLGIKGFAAAMFFVTYRYIMRALDSTYDKENTSENSEDVKNKDVQANATYSNFDNNTEEELCDTDISIKECDNVSPPPPPMIAPVAIEIEENKIEDNNEIKGNPGTAIVINESIPEENEALQGGGQIPLEHSTKKKSHKRLIIWISALAIVAGCVAVAFVLYLDSQKPEVRMKNADELFKQAQINKAMKIYTSLAEEDYIPAKARLGELYLINDSVEFDSVLGMKYLRETAFCDTSSLQLLIKVYAGLKCKGNHLLKDYENAQYYANYAIDRKVCLGCAYNALGHICMSKAEEKEGDDSFYNKSFFYFQKSCEFGYVPSILNIAYCYTLGLGCQQDVKLALEYINTAIAKDPQIGYSYYLKGGIYYDGFGGIQRDKLLGRDLIKKAADMGDENAIEKYAEILGKER